MIYIDTRKGDFSRDFNADFAVGGTGWLYIPKTYTEDD